MSFQICYEYSLYHFGQGKTLKGPKNHGFLRNPEKIRKSKKIQKFPPIWGSLLSPIDPRWAYFVLYCPPWKGWGSPIVPYWPGLSLSSVRVPYYHLVLVVALLPPCFGCGFVTLRLGALSLAFAG